MLKIFSVIVTYNPELVDLKQQIKLISDQKSEIIVVDNNSTNLNLLSEMCASFGSTRLTLIRNSENIGLAKAQNIGINLALQNNASHVILFDQDSIPDDNFFSKLLTDEAYLISNGIKFSAIGPVTYDPVSMEPYPITRYVGPFIRRIYPSSEKPVEATFIIASGCLIRADILRRIGGMRDELFIDYIDVEWCLRANGEGLPCFVSPNARMSHRVGDKRVRFLWRTIAAHSPLRRYYLLRNSFYISRLSYIPLSYKLREVALNSARVIFFFFISDDKKKYIKYMSLALRDGWSGNYGKLNEI